MSEKQTPLEASASHSPVVEAGYRHELKCWPLFFIAVKHGYKNFEVRRDDRTPQFAAGDVLRLREWHPSISDYSGQECERMVTFVLRDAAEFGVKAGYCVMSLAAHSDRSLVGCATSSKSCSGGSDGTGKEPGA